MEKGEKKKRFYKNLEHNTNIYMEIVVLIIRRLLGDYPRHL